MTQTFALEMKVSAVSLSLLICLIGFAGQANDLKTEALTIEWDHWLWMKRIAVQDPDWTPENFDPTNRKIRMFERKSAREIYEACGINLVKGEAFIYGPTTTQMIVRLGNENFRRILQIHETMDDWRSGRVDKWHLDWVPRPNHKAATKTGANKPE